MWEIFFVISLNGECWFIEKIIFMTNIMYELIFVYRAEMKPTMINSELAHSFVVDSHTQASTYLKNSLKFVRNYFCWKLCDVKCKLMLRDSNFVEM